MEVIHTAEYIKRQAKKIKKELNISHSEALEILAKQYGYVDWKSLQTKLAQNTKLKPK